MLAFRKTNELGRDGYAISEVYAKLLRKQGAYKLRYPKAGQARGVRLVAPGAGAGQGRQALPHLPHVVGTPATPTVFGTYHFYLQTPGTNAKGMVDSSYFIRGYAIHGYASVPAYPASHGCLRVPIPNALQIYNWVDIGDPIFLYE